jgi:hypothetical protein
LTAEQQAALAAAKAAADAIKPAPVSREDALKRIGALKADKEWAAKYLGGDPAARKEMTDAVKAAYGSDDADTTELGARLAALQRNGLPDPGTPAGDDLQAIMAGKPISAAVRKAAEAKKSMLMKDAGFRERYLGGDVEARRQLTTLSVILAAQVQRGAA